MMYLVLGIVIGDSVVSEFVRKGKEPGDHGFLGFPQHDCLIVPGQVITSAKDSVPIPPSQHMLRPTHSGRVHHLY